MRRRRVVWLAVLLALLLVAGAQAMTPFAHRSMARARRDAARELASVVLPHGAMKVSHDPSVHHALGPAGIDCTRKYVVDDHGFWRIPGQPAKVWTWLRNHPVPHSDYHHAGSNPYGSKPVSWFVDADFKDQRNVVFRSVDMTLRPARGGGTALRADATAVGEPRPDAEPCLSPY